MSRPSPPRPGHDLHAIDATPARFGQHGRAPDSLVDLRTGKATKAKKRLGKSVRLDVVRLIETADAGKPAPPSRVVIKLPRYDYDEIIDALEGEEDDAADSDAGEDYELVG